MTAIENATVWLENGNVLNKNGSPYVEKLSDSNVKISEQALTFLEDIQRQLSVAPKKNSDIISIAVQDMKIITGLLKLIIVYGVFPIAGEESAPNLAGRIPKWTLPPIVTKNHAYASSVSTRLTNILKRKDDIASLIFISFCMVDILALVAACNESEYTWIVSQLPTVSLYKWLIQLKSASGNTASNFLITKTLNNMVIDRKDSVRTLIELTTETPDGSLDLSNIEKVLPAFSTVPRGVTPGLYIASFGQQLFDIISGDVFVETLEETSRKSLLVEGTLILVTCLSDSRPALLGKLRDLIVAPFVQQIDPLEKNNSQTLMRKSTNALLRVLNKKCSFSSYLASKTVLSLWLLACTEGNTGSVSKYIISLLSTCLADSPKLIDMVVSNLLILNIKNNLNWVVQPEKPPFLCESITTNENNIGFMEQIDRRILILISVLQDMDDKPVGECFGVLMNKWALSSNFSKASYSDGMAQLFTVKTIEKVSSESSIKGKLFNNPSEIVHLCFTILKNYWTMISVESSGKQKVEPVKLLLNEQGDSQDDSDDEEIEESGSNGMNKPLWSRDGADEANESELILELSLNLLGSVLMELTAEATIEVSAEEKSLIKALASQESLPKTVRARADFCFELVSGAKRLREEVDLNDNVKVHQAALEALREPLVPSRAYGMHLISKLLCREAISLDEAMSIFINELGDNDSYIYLNAIKAIEEASRNCDSKSVIRLLATAIIHGDNTEVDKCLRAREAFVRCLTPGTALVIKSTLIDGLVEDLRAKASQKVDIRLRLSSCSILGILLAQFALSIEPSMQSEITDCALGILRFEKESDIALKRAATVLALEVLNAVNENHFQHIPRSSLKSLVAEVRSVSDTTNDETLKDLCSAVFSSTARF